MSHQNQARLGMPVQIGTPRARLRDQVAETQVGCSAANWATVSSLADSSSCRLSGLRISTSPMPAIDLGLNLPSFVLMVTRSVGLIPFIANTQSSSEMRPESTVMVEPIALIRPGSLVGEESPSF